MNKSSSFHYKTSRDPYSYFQIFSTKHTFLGIYQHVQKIPIEDSSHFQIVNKIVHRTKKGRKRGSTSSVSSLSLNLNFYKSIYPFRGSNTHSRFVLTILSFLHFHSHPGNPSARPFGNREELIIS